MITRNYDLIVVGAGAARLAAAIRYLDPHTSLKWSLERRQPSRLQPGDD